MKKIDFVKHILPHVIAIGIFLVVTVAFFSPVFFEDKTLEQHDIQQYLASSHSAMEYREATGQEPLWSKSMFGGMPLYLVNVQWDNQPVSYTKFVLSLGLTHPYCNIYLAFLCYYIMLLAFGVRSYLAIAGALAFGLSSYMILGLSAGHNGRIGAIAFMPLIIAGMQLVFANRKILGFGVSAMGMALQLRENHLQITYYLAIVAVIFGLVKLVEAIMQKKLGDYLKGLSVLILAACIGIGSFFGQLWAITEYTKYSIRGPSELVKSGATTTGSGLTKDYAFQYKYGIYEPLTLLIPSFYGGSSSNYFVQDENSATYKALMEKGDAKTFNQLAAYSSAYWGPQSFTGGAYYAGAIVIFLFVVGLLFAEKKYVIWLLPLCLLSIMISWGDSFPSFNYFLFDHLPGFNKFRSFNFALIIILFAMPLLGLLGVEKLWSSDFNKTIKKKLLIALGVVGGICFLFLIFAGIGSFVKTGPGAGDLPGWYKSALAEDRISLFRIDAARSLAFIALGFAVLYFELHKKITVPGAALVLVALVSIDLATVNKRYFKDESFKLPEEQTFLTMNLADMAILKDTTSYRVFAFNEPFGTDARASYFHDNIGGYHGAKMKRYQDFFDSCFSKQAQEFSVKANQGKIDLAGFQAANMLNVKYLVFGDKPNAVLPNNQVNGNAWFVQKVAEVKSPTEELKKACNIDTKTIAVVDGSKFKIPETGVDSTASIKLIVEKPNYLKYKAVTSTNGLAVFSEIYYPKGWIAT
ncbi:MAG TPA: hypothetical protein VD905_08535, partial [Flavobacteriales bacterium]|nr:hypothetical protein [Flavobacteriales bacterium]